jgi:hypothetical protein
LSGNIEIITRFEHAFRSADQATIDELCDPGLVDHNPAPDHEPTLAGFKQKVAFFKTIFPDLEEDLQDIIASSDTIATRWVVTGSLQQEFMGSRFRPDDQGREHELLPPSFRDPEMRLTASSPQRPPLVIC